MGRQNRPLKVPGAVLYRSVTVLDSDSSLPRFQRHQHLHFGDYDLSPPPIHFHLRLPESNSPSSTRVRPQGTTSGTQSGMGETRESTANLLGGPVAGIIIGFSTVLMTAVHAVVNLPGIHRRTQELRR